SAVSIGGAAGGNVSGSAASVGGAGIVVAVGGKSSGSAVSIGGAAGGNVSGSATSVGGAGASCGAAIGGTASDEVSGLAVSIGGAASSEVSGSAASAGCLGARPLVSPSQKMIRAIIQQFRATITEYARAQAAALYVRRASFLSGSLLCSLRMRSASDF